MGKKDRLAELGEGYVSVTSWLWGWRKGWTQENTQVSGMSGWKLKKRKGGESLFRACFDGYCCSVIFLLWKSENGGVLAPGLRLERDLAP